MLVGVSSDGRGLVVIPGLQSIAASSTSQVLGQVVCLRWAPTAMDGSGHKKNLVKLSEESLMKEPEDVFDLLEKIGEG